jgi:6-phosphogluconolactonase
MAFEWQSWASAEQAADACAARIAALLEEAASLDRLATLAVSGGTTPKLLFERLAGMKIAWARVHLFWVDERAVPPADPQSNFKLANDHLILAGGIPQGNVHRILAELAPAAAAQRYTEEIRGFFSLSAGELPRFDVVHRGMGPDAHTASLFPGEPLIGDRQGIAAAVYVQKLAQWRITLLPGVLLNAAHTVVLTAGDDKAEAVRAVFKEPHDPGRFPAQLGRDRSASWFLDDAAARLLRI